MRGLWVLLVIGLSLLAAGWIFRNSKDVSAAAKLVMIIGGLFLTGIALVFLVGAGFESVRSLWEQ